MSILPTAARRCFSALYDALHALALLLYSPRLVYLILAGQKDGAALRRRCTVDAPSSADAPPRLLFHAVSVGETRALIPLAELLRRRYPQVSFVITNGTLTGHQEALRALPYFEAHLFLPYDFSWLMRRLVRRWQPSAAIVCENDLWYQHLHALQRRHAPVFVVNGKLSHSSARRFGWASGLYPFLTAPVQLFCMQNDSYAAALRRLGIDAARVAVTGNIKFDCRAVSAAPAPTLQRLRAFLHSHDDIPVIVAGSTHHDEELQLAQACQAALDGVLPWRLCLVPRHPERFDAVYKTLSAAGFDVARFSLFDGHSTPSAPLLLVDAMGVLNECYRRAAAALVGGSFVAGIGGHNILEPPLIGTPVFFGPHMHNQPDMVEMVHKYEAGRQVQNGSEALALIRELLTKPSAKQIMQQGCQLLQRHSLGSSQRTMDLLAPTLDRLFAMSKD